MNFDEGWRRLHWVLWGANVIFSVCFIIYNWKDIQSFGGKFIFFMVISFIPIIAIDIIKWVVDGFRKK